jgi:sterol desaturase/sphingolipid hydroxylase (fatty acid hydroxylase superfamily)
MEPTLVDHVLGTQTNYLTLAGPFFLALAAVEMVCAWWSRRDVYRLNDSLADLSCGVFDQLLKVFGRSLLVLMYGFVYEHWALCDVTALPALWKWVAAGVLFLGVDCCFYWQHRIAHLWSVPWAAHVVHHQSEEFNLIVALRQSAFEEYLLAVFYFPMAVLGFPPAWFLAMFSFNLIWQFWCHTRLIGKLGPLEWVFNTPSHHRVHHGKNPEYLDKNFAGTLIIWDRLFGTFEPEREEPVYGTTRPFASWNPLWANFHIWYELARDAWNAPYWWDKFKVWFMPLGWRPRGLPPKPPAPVVSRADVVKYDARVPAGPTGYILAQYGLAILLALYVLNRAEEPGAPMSLAEILLPGALVVLSLVTAGGLFERKAWAFPAEIVRLVALATWTVAFTFDSGYAVVVVPAAFVGLAGSLFWLAQLRNLFAAKAGTGTRSPLTPVLRGEGSGVRGF